MSMRTYNVDCVVLCCYWLPNREIRIKKRKEEMEGIEVVGEVKSLPLDAVRRCRCVMCVCNDSTATMLLR